MNCCKNIAFPLLCVLIVLSSFRNENERYGETITTQRGDEITFSRPKEREIVVGKSKVKRVTTEPPTPILLNGKKIHYFKDDHHDSLRELTVFQKAVDDYSTFQKMIDSAIAKEKAHLPVGYYKYELTNMVVDERGYIAYYETKGILQHHPVTNSFTKPVTIPVNPTSAYMINGIIAKQANRMRYTPLIISGTPTPYFSSFEYGFEKK